MRKLFLFVMTLAVMSVPTILQAQTITLAPGESREMTFNQKIDTIFVTNPSIANYKILGDKRLLFYGLTAGMTDVNVLGTDDKNLLSANIIVNDIGHADYTNNQLKIKIPQSNLQVVKIGQAYVIKGQAKTQEELENAQRIVAAATGNTPARETDTIGDNMGKDILTHYTFDNVINDAQVLDPKQINVQLTVASIDKSLVDNLGISWSYLGGKISNAFDHALESASAITSFNHANSGATQISFNAANFQGFINALHNNNDAKILAQPNLAMLSGHKASVLIGGQIPVVQYTSNGTPTTNYQNYGINLQVAAKVENNGRIRVALDQSVSDVVGSLAGAPILNTTSSQSSFEVANGQSFVIGGLYSTTRSEGLSKVPLLGDIPVLGAFFRNASTSTKEQELVIVATVHLVKPVDKNEIVLPNFDSTGTLQSFFNLRPLKKVYDKTQVTNFLQRGGFIQ